MSQDTATVEDGEQSGNQQCSTCGATFGSPQGLGGHLSQGSCPEGNSAGESSDPEPSEVEDFSDEAAQSIIDRLDFQGKDSDSLQTVAAKALIESGDTEGFAEAFGECPQCNWGQNGFEADYCIRHQPEADGDQGSEDDSRSESDSGSQSEPASTGTSPEGAEAGRAKYVAALRAEGLSIEDAEKAAEVRFG